MSRRTRACGGSGIPEARARETITPWSKARFPGPSVTRRRRGHLRGGGPSRRGAGQRGSTCATSKRRHLDAARGGGILHRWLAHPRPPGGSAQYLIAWRHPDGGTSDEPGPRQSTAHPQRLRRPFGAVVRRVSGTVLVAWGRLRRRRRAMRFPGGRRSRDGHRGAGRAVVAARFDADELLPLVANDGREYAELRRPRGFLGVMGDERPQLRCRALLLDPVDRDRSHSASPPMVGWWSTACFPLVADERATLRATRRHGRQPRRGGDLGVGDQPPRCLGWAAAAVGLSFFTDAFDAHESGFRWYRRLTRFAADVPAAAAAGRLDGVDVVMTCGTGRRTSTTTGRWPVDCGPRGAGGTRRESRRPQLHRLAGLLGPGVGWG